MKQLIYVSSAVSAMSEEELEALLDKARARNASRDLTGVLLYAGGNFIQVLEGDEQDVDEVFANILGDSRHEGCIVVRDEPIASRRFPDWSMGYRKYTDAETAAVPGYLDYLSTGGGPRRLAESGVALSVLDRFMTSSS